MGLEMADVKLLITHFCPLDKNMQYRQMAHLVLFEYRSLLRQRHADEHNCAVNPLEQQVKLEAQTEVV